MRWKPYIDAQVAVMRFECGKFVSISGKSFNPRYPHGSSSIHYYLTYYEIEEKSRGELDADGADKTSIACAFGSPPDIAAMVADATGRALFARVPTGSRPS